MIKKAVFIGRFSPVHAGHCSIFENILRDFDRAVVLIGSANKRVSIKNPFTFEQRKRMVGAEFARIAGQMGGKFAQKADTPFLQVEPIDDFLYNDSKWEAEVYYAATRHDEPGEPAETWLVGHEKDASSYYLKSFPHWRYREYPKVLDVDATDIRNAWFASQMSELPTEFISTSTGQCMEETRLKHPELLEEFAFYLQEQRLFADYPYPETLKFLCADAVTVCRGNVLLIRRKHAPGKGCWALPGGFVGQQETFAEAAVRELKEETGIKIPPRALEKQTQMEGHRKTFDDPQRSLGIPRVTTAFLFEVDPDPKTNHLPKVRAGDDAADTRWFPLGEVAGMPLYDDHKDIIDFFTGSL